MIHNELLFTTILTTTLAIYSPYMIHNTMEISSHPHPNCPGPGPNRHSFVGARVTGLDLAEGVTDQEISEVLAPALETYGGGPSGEYEWCMVAAGCWECG